MRLHITCSFLLTDLDDGLKNFNDSFNSEWTRVVNFDEIKALPDQLLRDHRAVFSETFIQGHVSMDQELDGLLVYVWYFTFEDYCPDHFCLLELVWVN